MLTVKRKKTQALIIETSDGTVTIYTNATVKLSVDAPKICKIRRAELEPKKSAA